ncbi:hypothetical protein [Bacillus sp. 1NLA3E]|uniref:hypothetical protein n=1 Tax=Bacillus sp. 1NLA3E TaxID=666686 RepID=UPI000247E59F|nr:hypothetical protein [Bacillus sp. 1NLA3E]AGK55240.1 hypothetical protein B1NLA3E_17480 [Bacillus sp. 1NLA3E]
MTRLFKGALLLMATVLLLSACSGNAKEEQKATNDKVVKMFNSTPKKANNKNKDIRFYLPFGFEIKEKSANNILLKNGSKKYILFYNPNETTVSKVVYNATIGINEKFEYKKTYKKDDQFGFLLIRKLDKNLQEVTVGIGGVKITTETKTKSMKSDAETMMQIVKSVKIVEKTNKK